MFVITTASNSKQQLVIGLLECQVKLAKSAFPGCQTGTITLNNILMTSPNCTTISIFKAK